MMRRSDFGDNPFDFERMFERMNRQFEEMNRQFARFADTRPALESGSALPTMWSQGGVRVDVAERADSVVVTADLPGFEKDDIDLSVANDALTIRAERDVDDAYESENFVRRERRHHSVSRTVPLPTEVVEEEATASYTSGVLTVTLPVVEADDADEDNHRIDIE